jgi:4-hydroxybenzoate polyprenyltransferase
MKENSNLLPYARLLRLPNGFTALSNILAAQLIVTGGQLQWAPLLLLMLASWCLYSGGIVLNDWFDYEEDLRERPGRPLPAGLVPRAHAVLLGFGLLALGVLLAAAVGPVQLLIAGGILLLVLFYDGHAKHTAYASLAMGACRYGNWVLGLSTGGLGADTWLLALPVFIYVTALTQLSRAETSAGSRRPLVLCGLGLLLGGASIVALHLGGLLPNAWALPVLVMAMALVGQRLWATWRNYTPAGIQRMVKTLVLGIIPLDAILAIAGGPWWGGLLVLALYLPGTWLARKMYVT